MNVLITGSSGSLGRHLTRALSTDPRFHSVIGVDIRKPDCLDIREPMGDLLRAHRIDTVIHAAFVVRPIRDERLMAEINVEGSRNVLASSIAAGVQRLIHMSSATVYGFHPNGGPYTEDEPCAPNPGFLYAENKCAVERSLASHAATGAQPSVTILRPSFLVEPDTGNPLLEYLTRRVPLLPYPAAPLQLTHMEDMVEIIRLILLNGLTGVFNVGADGALDAGWMARRLGKFPVRMPYPVLSTLNAIAWRCRIPLAPTPAWAMQLLCHPWIVSSNRLLRETGYRFRYTTSTAFEEFAANQLRRLPQKPA